MFLIVFGSAAPSGGEKCGCMLPPSRNIMLAHQLHLAAKQCNSLRLHLDRAFATWQTVWHKNTLRILFGWIQCVCGYSKSCKAQNLPKTVSY